MSSILSIIMSVLCSVIDEGLTVADKLPQGVGNGAAVLILFFLVLIVPIFWMALSKRTGEW